MTILFLLLCFIGVGMLWLARQDYNIGFGKYRREMTRLQRLELARKTWTEMIERDRKF